MTIRVKYIQNSNNRGGCGFAPRPAGTAAAASAPPPNRQVRFCMGAQCVFGILAVNNNVTGIKIHTFTPVLTFCVHDYSFVFAKHSAMTCQTLHVAVLSCPFYALYSII